MRSRDIVCIWAFGWFGLWQRHQQLMSRLSRNHRILYIESPRDLWSFIRGLFKKQITFTQVFFPRRVLENLFLFSPLVPFSLKKFPKLNQTYLSIILPYVRHMVKSLEMVHPILWICYPSGAYFIGKLDEDMTIYDCCDDLTDVPPPLAEQIIEQEKSLMKKADMVFVTTDELYESKKKSCSRIFLIPNGADFDHFKKAALDDLSLPKDLLSIKKPIIGFSGSVQHWIDIDLIYFSALQRPNWAFVIVGGVHVDVGKLRSLSNVYFLGQKQYIELPHYLRCFDVCILPFKLNKIALASDPIKVYEYLAAGKPVVSTDIPRVRRFGIVKVARNKEEFIIQIEKELSNENKLFIRNRMRIAQENSWNGRVEMIHKVFQSILSEQ